MINRVLAPIIASESIFSVVIMAICLAIYFKTEELEKLSQYRGIIYFRRTFFFFAISYFFKFITRTIIFSFAQGNWIPIYVLTPAALTFSISIYASVMAFFYLINSISWEGEGKYLEIMWHIIAVVVGVFTVFVSGAEMFVAIQLMLLAFGVYKMVNKKRTRLYLIYLLLLCFWTISIVEIFVPDMVFEFQLMVYLVSGLLFSTILYYVMKSTRV